MKPKTSLRRFFPSALALISLTLAAGNAHAASASWTGAGADALWSNTTNWSASPVPGTGDTATFNAAAGAGGTVIDLESGVTVNTISFVSVGTPSTLAAYTIGSGGANAQSLILNGSGNAGLASSGTATTAQITINAAITVNNTQQWVLNQGANPWIINGNVTPNGPLATTRQVKINGHSAIFNGILADQVGGAILQISGANAQTATLTNPNSTFTGGLFFDNGSVNVNSIGLIGSPSAAGAGGDLLFGSGFGGGALIYVGTGNTTDRVISINQGFNGPTLTQSGASGLLNFTSNVIYSAAASSIGSPTLTLNGSAAGTGEISGNIPDNPITGTTMVKTGVALGATSIQLHSVDGIAVGAAVSGTGIAGGTTVSTITPGTKTITFSPGTSGAVAQGAILTIDGVKNITRVTKAGTGSWALSGAGNTFTGTITLNSTTASGGTLSYASAGGTNPIIFNATTGFNTTLSYIGSSPLTMSGLVSATALTTGGININADGTSPTATINYSNPASLSSTSTSTSTRFISFNGANTGDNTFAGAINKNTGVGGNTQVAKNGAGKWVLTGTSNFSGGLFVNNGTLSVSSIPNGGVDSPLGATTRINLGRDNNDGILIYTGAGDSTDRDVRIGGPSTASGTGGSSFLNDGSGALIFTTPAFNISQTGIVFNRTLTLGGSYSGGVNEIQGAIQDNTASTGLVNLEKTGGGTWKLSNSNTYTGTTAINGGTLSFTGATQATSTITVGASGKLGLDIASPVTASAATVTLGGSVQVTGSPVDPSYTLLTATSITGTPVLSPTIPGYQLVKANLDTELRLVQTGAPTGYAAWQAANSTAGTRDQDHDGDGVDNGTEHFLGGTANTTGFTALPSVANIAGTLSVTWTKAASYTGSYTTDYVVETSTTLAGPWTTETLGVSVTETGNDVIYTFPGGPAYSGKNFARLKVTGP